MADVGLLEADHEPAKLRQTQPVRHLLAQHAPLVFGPARLAFAGDDKHEGQPFAMGVLQEAE